MKRLGDLLGPELSSTGTGRAGDNNGFGEVMISGLTLDSRKVGAGMLFAAMPGATVDGAKFIPAALASGAAAILCAETADVPETTVPVLRATNPRLAIAKMAARFFGRQPEVCVAVTGTSGKSSVAEFTRQIFAACGHQAASVGTIGIVKPDGAVYGSLTTPDPITLHETLANLADEGVTHLAFEASSHGLDQHRLDGVRLQVAAFTNLGRDHLDYHPTLADYLDAKLRLFSELLPDDGQAVVFVGDGAGPPDHAGDDVARAAFARVLTLVEERGLKTIRTGVGSGDLVAKLLTPQSSRPPQQLHVSYGESRKDVALPLAGRYQIYNALVAAGLAIAAGCDPDDVFDAIAQLRGVPGRLELVGHANGAPVLIDYAHKPDALEAVLTTLETDGRLICVFGCGGDRDAGKRKLMGEIAVQRADITIVTDDNPRSEDPASIRSQILAAAPGAIEIGDRAESIRYAIRLAREDDVVVIAGKGHETGQIVGDQVLPFSDQETARAVLNEPLWQLDDLIIAAEAEAEGAETDPITGFSIDTRSLRPGDVFVALCDVRDGHEFVGNAFKAGASAALVRADYNRGADDGLLLRVDDPLKALERIGAAARSRLSPRARVVAVTGSAGKTTTKEMLRAAFEAIGQGPVHAPEKSFNNHWGVPLTLARMPQDTAFAVLEIGMNHADEIRPLSKLVRPHVAVITSILPVHVGNFPDGLDGVARAKAEIFEGLEPDGIAIIPEDSDYRDMLIDAVQAHGGEDADIRAFGEGASSTIRILEITTTPERNNAVLGAGDERRLFELSLAGRHHVFNAVAGLIAVRSALDSRDGFEADNNAAFEAAWAAFGQLKLAPEGRGQVFELRDGMTLIDESYNANPASVAAALERIALYAPARRRVAVLGDMLELGAAGAELHQGLATSIEQCRIDQVFAAGPLMRHLFDALPANVRGGWAETSDALASQAISALRPGDVVVVKGSLGSRMQPLTAELKARYAKDDNAGE